MLRLAQWMDLLHHMVPELKISLYRFVVFESLMKAVNHAFICLTLAKELPLHFGYDIVLKKKTGESDPFQKCI